MSGAQHSRPLLPHQQALADRFFAELNIRGYVVESSAGLGSSFAMAHIAKRLLEVQPTARILILSSRIVLQKQIEHTLTEIGVLAESVDRFRFRELQDGTRRDDAVWQEGHVFVLSTDFAKQEDIALSLCAIPWTLLIVPEAHQLSGLRRNVVHRLIDSSPNARLLLVTPSITKDDTGFGIESWTIIKWRYSDVVDEHGEPLFHQIPSKIESFEYRLDPQETRLRKELAALARLLAATREIPAPLASVFARSVNSSSAAVEEILQRLRSRLIHRDGPVFSTDEERDEETDADDVPSVIAGDRTTIMELLDSCLAILDSLDTDSKLALLWELISEAKALDEMPGSMCILTEYRATLLYIQEALEEIGVDAYILHGAMPTDEAARAIGEFNDRGGILIITMAMVPGIDLRHVDTLVLYDLPRSPATLDQLYGRFQRFGRHAPFVIQVLIESGKNDPAADAVLARLRAIGMNKEAG